MSELPGLKKPAIAALPRVRERMSFIYLEHCEISRQDSAITAMDARGTVHIPAASLAVLMLGPGTSVSHRAMELIGDNGACVIWVGEHGVRYYAHGRPLTRSAGLLSRQAALVSNARSRVAVARQMYLLRFPDEDIRRMSMQQLRGREGARVRQAYRQASLDSGIPWAGRAYDPQDFAGGSPINQALSAAHACLYGVAHSVIVALGCSPGLGFIHTGHERSFVYDIADLYKAQVTIPIAFQVVSRGEEDIAARTRRAVRDAMWEQRVIERAVRDINTLLQGEEQAAQEPEAEVLYLWDDREGVLAAGRSYAHSPPSSADSGADSPLDWHARRDAAGNPPG